MISSLDMLRSKILKMTLQFSLFDHLFRSRGARILFLGFSALTFYFLVGSFFPLWILVIGPIVWGVPHLISSLRYNTLLGTSIPKTKVLFYSQGLLWLLVFSYRILVDVFHYDLLFYDETFLVEGLALMSSFLLQLFLLRKITLRSLLYFLVFFLLMLITHDHPIEVALTLLIGHNYLPLVTWYQSCQNRKDLRVFSIFTTVYVFLSIAILSGMQEHLYTLFSSFIKPQDTLPLFNWNFMSIMEPFGAQSDDSSFWFRIVVLYAFSQSVHYFLWLKAIPENHQQQQFPPSFRWSFQKLQNDFGGSSIVILFGVLIAGFGYWAFFEYQSARTIYFAIASYHGFMELSCLPFLKSNRTI